MKKILIVIGVVVLLLLIALIILPMIFKPQLEQLVKDQANKNLNATVDFKGVGLNLFQDFPNFTLSIKQPMLINKAPFEGDTLAQISNFKIALNLKSLVFDKKVDVVSFVLDEPQIALKVAKDGAVNWDIVVPGEEPPAEKPEDKSQEAASFAILLQEYAIKNATFSYDDQQTGMSVLAANLNHQGSGNLTQDLFVVRTLTSIDEFTVGDGTVNYLTKALLKLKADIDVDVKNQTYTVRENEFQIGQLLLSFDGFIKQLGEELMVDLRFKTNQNEFKDLLAMVPAVYQGDIQKLQSSGTIALEGKIQGPFKDPDYPAFALQMMVNDGMFQHPQAPVPLQNFNMALFVNSPGGPLDNTVIDLSKFHAEIGSEPVDMNLQVKTPISDPHIQAKAKGNVNLQNVNSLIDPKGKAPMQGRVSADVSLAGNLSSIEKNAYEKLKVNGDVSVRDFKYTDPAMPDAITISEADLNLTQESARLKSFVAAMGKSDVRANGYISNFIPYVMNKGVLSGSLNVSSKFIDLNPLMQGGTTTEKTETSTETTAVFNVPDGIDFTLNSAFEEVLFGKLKIQNAGGIIKLQDKKLQLIDLKMNLLEGSVLANGIYENPEPTSAKTSFNLDISDFSIPAAFQNFMTVQKFLPIAENIKGTFGSSLQLSALMDSTMSLDYNSIISRGSAMLKDATVENLRPLEKLSQLIKVDRIKSLSPKDADMSFKIEDGRFILSPMSFTANDVEYVLSGSNGLDMSLNYVMKMKVPSGQLGKEANAKLNDLFNRQVDLLQSDHVVFDVSFTGNVKDPDVKVSGSDIVQGVGEKLTDIAKDELLKRAGLEADSTGSALDQPKQQLEEKKEDLEKKVEEEADKVKKKASDRLKNIFKKEGDK